MRFRTYAFVGGLIGLLGVLQLFHQGPSAKDDKYAEALERIQSRIQKIRRKLDTMESQKSNVESQLSDIEQRYGETARALRDLEKQASEQARRLAEVKRQRDRSAEAIAKHRSRLTGQVRAAYAMGRQERMKLILNQENPVRASRILAYYNYLNKARVAQIHAVEKDIKALESAEGNVVAESARLQALQGRKKIEQDALDRVRENWKTLLLQLDEEMKDKKDRLATLQEDEQTLKGLIESIQETLDDVPFDPGPEKPFDKLRGELAWPLRGQIQERFGAKRATSRWDGVLIKANEGADVHAVGRGRVVYADWLRGYGLLTIIDHGNGYMTLYAFNQSLYRSVDDWVEPGDVIAAVGASGGRANSGLYFGIRHRGKAEDPVKWCRKEQNGRVG